MRQDLTIPKGSANPPAGSKNCIRFFFYRGNFCGCRLCHRSGRLSRNGRGVFRLDGMTDDSGCSAKAGRPFFVSAGHAMMGPAGASKANKSCPEFVEVYFCKMQKPQQSSCMFILMNTLINRAFCSTLLKNIISCPDLQKYGTANSACFDFHGFAVIQRRREAYADMLCGNEIKMQEVCDMFKGWQLAAMEEAGY